MNTQQSISRMKVILAARNAIQNTSTHAPQAAPAQPSMPSSLPLPPFAVASATGARPGAPLTNPQGGERKETSRFPFPDGRPQVATGLPPPVTSPASALPMGEVKTFPDCIQL